MRSKADVASRGAYVTDSESQTRVTEHGVPRSNIDGSCHVYITQRKHYQMLPKETKQKRQGMENQK